MDEGEAEKHEKLMKMVMTDVRTGVKVIVGAEGAQ